MARHAAVMGARSSNRTSARWLTAGLAACALALAALLAGRAADWVGRDWHALWLQDRVAEWAGGRKPYTEAQWFQAKADLRRAERIMPNDAGLQDTLGVLHMLRGYQLWADTTTRTPYFDQALRHFELSTQLRPHVAQGWANVALCRYLVRKQPAEVFRAWERAVTLGPNEDDVNRMMLNVVMGSWSEADPVMRYWVAKMKTDARWSDELRAWEAYYGIEL